MDIHEINLKIDRNNRRAELIQHQIDKFIAKKEKLLEHVSILENQKKEIEKIK